MLGRIIGVIGPMGIQVINLDEVCRSCNPCRTDSKQYESQRSVPKPKNIRTIPTDTIRVYEDTDIVEINGICATIVCYKIIVPDKVILVEFADGTREKMTLNKGDKFDIDTGLRIAIAKHVGRKYYNVAGIENLAQKLSYLKCIDKMIHKAHVENRRRQRILDTQMKQKQIQDEAKAKRKAKKQAKRAGIKITKSPHKDTSGNGQPKPTKGSRNSGRNK